MEMHNKQYNKLFNNYKSKSYKPMNKVINPTNDTSKHLERCANVTAKHLQHLKDVQDLKEQVNTTNKAYNTTKNNNRRGYQIRMIAKQSFKFVVDKPANISPWLDLSLHGQMSFVDRLIQYNKKHKCQHGYKYTNYKIHSSIRENGTNKPVFLEPLCSCRTEYLVPAKYQMPCFNCTNKTLSAHQDTTCPAAIFSCNFCKSKFYKMERWNILRPPNIIEKKVQPVYTSTFKGWGTQNNEQMLKPVEIQKEFGESFVAPIKALFVKLQDFAHNIVDWFSSAFKGINEFKQVVNIWKGIVVFCKMLLEEIAKRPIQTIYYITKLLFADTLTERIWILALVAENAFLGNIFSRMLQILGLSDVLPAHKANDYNSALVKDRCVIAEMKALLTMKPVSAAHSRAIEAEKQQILKHDFGGVNDVTANRFDFKGLSEEEMMEELYQRIYKRTAKFQADIDAEIETRKLVSFGFDDEPKSTIQEITKEEGFDLINVLFNVSKWPAKFVSFELIKNFNTICSGWKNLHELIMSLFSYLPDWLTCVFRHTDPNKRFGYDAKTKGNPVYDMVEAYKTFLSGSDKTELYNDFLDKWKKSENYILTEYTPNQNINRHHKQYFLNAKAIMSPGTKGGKPIPFVVTLFGIPGIGKSTLWPLLISGIVPGTVQHIRSMSYTRNSGCDHYDGYNPEKHKIFVYDDFASQVDDPAANELLSIVSNADFLPPYASNDDINVGLKGTSFNSPLVILCSNFLDFRHCHQNASSTAVARRIGIVISWAKDWRKNEFTISETQKNGDQLPYTEGDKTIFTLEEVQSILRRKYIAHFEAQKTIFDDLNKMLFRGEEMNFLKLYAQADPTHLNDDAVRDTFISPHQIDKENLIEISKENALFGMGFGLIVPITYRFADIVDVRYEKVMKSIAALTLALGVVTGLYLYFHAKPTQAESGEGSVAKAIKAPIFQRVSKEAGNITHENIIKNINTNAVSLQDQAFRTVNGVFLKGRCLLTVKHFVKVATKITVYSSRAHDMEIYSFDVKDLKIVEIPDDDLAIIKFPDSVQPYKDITRYLAAEPVAGKCDCYVTRRDKNNYLVIYNTKMNATRVFTTWTDSKTIRTGYCDITYEMEHTNGDCGNLVFAVQNGNLKIVGLHESGSVTDKNESFAIMLNKAEINKHINSFNELSRDPDFVHEVMVDKECSSVNKTQYLAHCEKHLMSPIKSEIIESCVFDKVYQHTHMPALLRKTSEFDPMAKALNKYGLSTTQFDREQVKIAVDSIRNKFKALYSNKDIKRKLTINECLNGIPGLVESVDTTTSSGYPFSLYPEYRGAKIKLFEGKSGEYTLGNFAQEEYNRWENLLSRGIVPSDPFLATLKDEKRKIEKVKAGKTRVFCAGSLTSFLFNKQHFGGFCEFFKRTRKFTFSTLGMNKASREWDEMFKTFREVGDKGLDGDQEEWDGRFKSEIALALLPIFDDFYGKQDHKIRRILFEHAIFPLLRITWSVNGKISTWIMEVAGCMPSGWFLTFLLNSLVNAVLQRLGWMNLVIPPYNDLYYFNLYVREKYAGDDSWLSVATPFLKYFNNITLAEFFKKYDQIYTPAIKTGELVAYQELKDCSFLKTKTGILFDSYVPLFDMDANMDTLNWIRKCLDKEKATEDNCNDVLRNLFFYGRDIFENYRDKILEIKPSYNLIHYHSLETSYLGYGEVLDPYGSFMYTKNRNANPSTCLSLAETLKGERADTSSKLTAIVKESSGTYNMELQKQLKEENQNKFESSEILRATNELIQGTFVLDELVGKKKKIIAKDMHPRSKINELNQLQRKFSNKYVSFVGNLAILENLAKNEYDKNNCQKFEAIRNRAWTAINKESGQEIPQKLLDMLKLNKSIIDSVYNMHLKAVSLMRMPGQILDEDIVQVARKNLLELDYYSGLYKGLIPTYAECKAKYDVISYNELKSVEIIKESGLSKQQPVLIANETPSQVSQNDNTLDDSTPIVTSKQGVHLSEQTDVVTIKPMDGNYRPTYDRAMAHLNETDWDLMKMLDRSNLVGVVNWDLTKNVGDLLTLNSITAQDVPKDLLKNELVSTPFLRFIYWRCDRIKLRFEIAASRFHQGRVLCFFYPTMYRKENLLTPALLNPTMGTQLSHIFLDPANGTTAELEIPFIFPKGYIDLVKGDSLGQVYVMVLSKLQIATGATNNVDIKVFVNFENSRFKVPRPSQSSFEELLQEEAERRGYTLIRKEMGILADLGKSVGGELDNLVSDILPKEITGAVAGVLLDKPAVTEFPPPLVNKDAQYMSSSRGVENLERMTLEPSAQYLTDDQLGSVDEMDISYLIKKPVYVSTFNWPSTSTVGTILDSRIVSPMHIRTDASPVRLHPLQYFGDMFTYWRGSIVYIFQIVGSAFHEGRLDFTSHPAVTTAPTNYVAGLSQYVNSQTIRNTNNTVEVRVVFHSETPWKRIWHGEALSDVFSATAFPSTDFTIGCLATRVSVPLKNPNNVANNVDVNVFVKAGDDFEFHTLSPYAGSWIPVPATTIGEAKVARRRVVVKKESGDLNTDSKNDNGVIPLGIGDVYTHDMPIQHFGENYKSLREICKRYVQQYNVELTGGNEFGSTVFSLGICGGSIGKIAKCFRLFRGPMNMKLECLSASRKSGFVTTIPFSSTSTAAINTLKGLVTGPSDDTFQLTSYPLVRFSNTQVAEFVIPFQSIYHSLTILDPSLDQTNRYNSNIYDIITLVFALEGEGDCRVRQSAAFGDETRLGVWLGCPVVQKNSNPIYPTVPLP